MAKAKTVKKAAKKITNPQASAASFGDVFGEALAYALAQASVKRSSAGGAKLVVRSIEIDAFQINGKLSVTVSHVGPDGKKKTRKFTRRT